MKTIQICFAAAIFTVLWLPNPAVSRPGAPVPAPANGTKPKAPKTSPPDTPQDTHVIKTLVTEPAPAQSKSKVIQVPPNPMAAAMAVTSMAPTMAAAAATTMMDAGEKLAAVPAKMAFSMASAGMGLESMMLASMSGMVRK